MIYSILAGIAITIGAVVNLMCGGLAGALGFSIGLLMICTNGWYLYTGQAGKIANREVGVQFLTDVFVGNFFGAYFSALAISFTPAGLKIGQAAAAILEGCTVNWAGTLLLSIFCGLLVNYAVTQFKEKNNPFYIVFPVAAFIICGFPHTIALMSYMGLAAFSIEGFIPILLAAIGNTVGCNIIPLAKRIGN